MAGKNAFSNIKLNGNYSEDGEYFLVSLDLNGTPIRFANVYVGDQREAFAEAANGGKAKDDTTDE